MADDETDDEAPPLPPLTDEVFNCIHTAEDMYPNPGAPWHDKNGKMFAIHGRIGHSADAQMRFCEWRQQKWDKCKKINMRGRFQWSLALNQDAGGEEAEENFLAYHKPAAMRLEQKAAERAATTKRAVHEKHQAAHRAQVERSRAAAAQAAAAARRAAAPPPRKPPGPAAPPGPPGPAGPAAPPGPGGPHGPDLPPDFPRSEPAPIAGPASLAGVKRRRHGNLRPQNLPSHRSATIAAKRAYDMSLVQKAIDVLDGLAGHSQMILGMIHHLPADERAELVSKVQVGLSDDAVRMGDRFPERAIALLRKSLNEAGNVSLARNILGAENCVREEGVSPQTAHRFSREGLEGLAERANDREHNDQAAARRMAYYMANGPTPPNAGPLGPIFELDRSPSSSGTSESGPIGTSRRVPIGAPPPQVRPPPRGFWDGSMASSSPSVSDSAFSQALRDAAVPQSGDRTDALSAAFAAQEAGASVRAAESVARSHLGTAVASPPRLSRQEGVYDYGDADNGSVGDFGQADAASAPAARASVPASVPASEPVSDALSVNPLRDALDRLAHFLQRCSNFFDDKEDKNAQVMGMVHRFLGDLPRAMRAQLTGVQLEATQHGPRYDRQVYVNRLLEEILHASYHVSPDVHNDVLETTLDFIKHRDLNGAVPDYRTYYRNQVQPREVDHLDSQGRYPPAASFNYRMQMLSALKGKPTARSPSVETGFTPSPSSTSWGEDEINDEEQAAGQGPQGPQGSQGHQGPQGPPARAEAARPSADDSPGTLSHLLGSPASARTTNPFAPRVSSPLNPNAGSGSAHPLMRQMARVQDTPSTQRYASSPPPASEAATVPLSDMPRHFPPLPSPPNRRRADSQATTTSPLESVGSYALSSLHGRDGSPSEFGPPYEPLRGPPAESASARGRPGRMGIYAGRGRRRRAETMSTQALSDDTVSEAGAPPALASVPEHGRAPDPAPDSDRTVTERPETEDEDETEGDEGGGLFDGVAGTAIRYLKDRIVKGGALPPQPQAQPQAGAGAGIADADEQVSLSENQIRAASHVPGLAIHTYTDLERMQTWDDIFRGCPARAAAVLFEVESPTQGHWLAVFDGVDGAHVFDPVGVALDAERSYVPSQRLAQLGETQPAFHRLLSTQSRPVHWNCVHFQKDAPGVNTCGRWSALRLQMRSHTDDEFAQDVKNGARQMGIPNLDAFVCHVVPV